MKLKQRIKQRLPSFLIKPIQDLIEAWKFRSIPKLNCDTTTLHPRDGINLEEFFSSSETEKKWLPSSNRLAELAIPDLTGGINPGDRRAIYYLIRELKPSSVLEIGTFIGASTLLIAEALHMNQPEGETNLVTVDINDVNNSTSKPWLKYGVKQSPIEMVYEMGFRDSVKFVQDTSLHYLATCEKKFDFIFLDGDHSGSTVYQEIPLALKLLNHDGLILLHDYHPNLKPLWPNDTVIPGPFKALKRFNEEGANLTAFPLGELPWATKLQSNATSLALLLRKH